MRHPLWNSKKFIWWTPRITLCVKTTNQVKTVSVDTYRGELWEMYRGELWEMYRGEHWEMHRGEHWEMYRGELWEILAKWCKWWREWMKRVKDPYIRQLQVMTTPSTQQKSRIINPCHSVFYYHILWDKEEHTIVKIKENLFLFFTANAEHERQNCFIPIFNMSWPKIN
jgi:hypothetical protein